MTYEIDYEYDYLHVDRKANTFSQLPETVKEDLIEWYNARDPDFTDQQRLLRLYQGGLFRAWTCPGCGDRVRSGQPKDWGHFQGVCEPDFMSYPGDLEKHTPEYNAALCDDCRSHTHYYR